MCQIMIKNEKNFKIQAVQFLTFSIFSKPNSICTFFSLLIPVAQPLRRKFKKNQRKKIPFFEKLSLFYRIPYHTLPYHPSLKFPFVHLNWVKNQKFCFQTHLWSQSSTFELLSTWLPHMVNVGQQKYPKMQNLQNSPYWINLEGSFANISTKNKVNGNKFRLFLKEKNRLIFFR